jgi:hypothetical protein
VLHYRVAGELCLPAHYRRRSFRRFSLRGHAAASLRRFASRSWMPRSHPDILKSLSQPPSASSPFPATVERLQFASRIHRHRSTSPQFISQSRSPFPCVSARPARANPSRRSRPSTVVFPGIEQSVAMSSSPWLALYGAPSPQPLRVFISPCCPIAHKLGFRS